MSDPAGSACRVSHHEGVRDHVLGDHRARANQGMVTDTMAADDGAVGAQRRAPLHVSGHVLSLADDVASGCLDVGKYRGGAAKNIVFERAAIVDTDVVLNFDVMAQANRTGDEGILADVAILADLGTGHNMGEMPDPGAPPNATRDIDAGRLVNQDLGKGRFVWHGSVVIERLAWLLMTITPALGTAVLIESLGASFDNFTPATSDEVGYYLQINAFVHYGFSGGYFTIAEKPAPASF